MEDSFHILFHVRHTLIFIFTSSDNQAFHDSVNTKVKYFLVFYTLSVLQLYLWMHFICFSNGDQIVVP